MSYEEDTCATMTVTMLTCPMRRRTHVSYEEEDTCFVETHC